MIAPADTPAPECDPGFIPFRDWRPWLVLFLLVASRLLLVAFATSLSGDDGDRYLTEAVNVWKYGTLSTGSGVNPPPTAHDLPVFPLIMAGFLFLVKAPLLAAKLTSFLNCILFGIAAKGVYDLAFRLSGNYGTATVAMLIFGCFPESFPYSVFYMPESLFLAFFVWCLVLFVDFLRTRRLPPLFAAFLLWGCAMLAKPIAIFVGPVLAAIAIALILRRRRSVFREIAAVVAGLALGASLLAPWLIRNKRDFGVFGLTLIAGSNLFNVNYASMVRGMGAGDSRQVLNRDFYAAIHSVPPERANPLVQADALGWFAVRKLLANPWPYLWTTIERHPRLYFGTGSIATLRLLGDTRGALMMQWALVDRKAWTRVPWRALVLQLGSWIVLGVAYAATAIGVVGLVRHRNWSTLGVIALAFLYFAILLGPLTATRYRVVMLPVFSVAAAIGFTRCFERRPSL